MAVGGIDDDDVYASFHQRRHPIVRFFARADAGTGAQLTVLVLAGVRIGLGFGDVLDGNHAFELEIRVHQQHLLDAMPMQQFGDRLRRGVLRCRHQAMLGRHHIDHLGVHACLEANVAARNDAHQIVATHYRHAGDLVVQGQPQQLMHGGFRLDDDGIPNHAALELLHRPHLAGLAVYRQVLVDDSNAAFLRQGDGETGFGYRIHGRRDERNVEPDAPRQARFQLGLGWQYVGTGGQKEYVVVG